MNTIKISKIIVILLLLLVLLPINGQENIPFTNLTTALDTKNFEQIETLLSQSQAEEQAEIERRILEEVRKAILSNQLETAGKLAEIVLLNNFDNANAQELFLAVEEARTQQRLLEERRIQTELQEKQRIAAEEEQKRTEAEKRRRQEEEDRKKAELESLVKNVTTFGLQNVGFKFALAPLDIHTSASNFANTYSGEEAVNMRYGFGFYGKGWFNHPYLLAAIESHGTLSPVAFIGQDSVTQFTGRMLLGFPFIIGPAVICVGYQSLEYSGTDTKKSQSALFTALSGPTIGAGIHNLSLPGSFNTSLYIEWHTISATDDIADLILSAELQADRPLVNLSNSVQLTAGASIKYNMISIKSDVEWALSSSLFLGVLINAK